VDYQMTGGILGSSFAACTHTSTHTALFPAERAATDVADDQPLRTTRSTGAHTMKFGVATFVTDEGVRPDRGAMLVGAVVIARDRSGPDIGAGTHRRVADVT